MWADSFFGAQNERTEAGITRPSSATVSGSPASLVPWDSLGRTGRDFVAEATSAEELAQFHGADARLAEPVRVYAGVRSADTLQQRADLAVRELERAGGFDRAVLVVWIPTGSGWMIPEAADALEQLYAGDTAIVGMQYSYLPSLLSVFLDPGLAARAGAVLFNTVARPLVDGCPRPRVRSSCCSRRAWAQQGWKRRSRPSTPPRRWAT